MITTSNEIPESPQTPAPALARSSDIATAAYWHVNGLRFVKAERASNGRRVIFCFADNGSADQLEKQFLQGGTVAAENYSLAMAALRRIMHGVLDGGAR